jgi:hypothetical protein
VNRLPNGWVWPGVAVGLLASFLSLQAALCPPAAEAVFGITILGTLIAGILGAALRRRSERFAAFLIGLSVGFAAAFVLFFTVFARFIDSMSC